MTFLFVSVVSIEHYLLFNDRPLDTVKTVGIYSLIQVAVFELFNVWLNVTVKGIYIK